MASLNFEGLELFYSGLFSKFTPLNPALDSCSGILAIEKGGTGANSAGQARVNLGITSTSTQTVYHTGNILPVSNIAEISNPTEGMIALIIS